MARCTICHRTLTNTAHIAAGMGPVCAAKAAKRASVTDMAAARRAYPMERYAMIQRAVQRLADMEMQASRAWTLARAEGTPEQAAAAERTYRLVQHWYARARRMEQRAYRLVTSRAA